MACCQGDPTKMIKIGGGGGTHYSKEQQELQKQLIGMISPQLGKGASPYPGAVTAAVDPLQLMASNIMMNYGQGRGYTAPPFMNAQGMAGAGSSVPSTPIDMSGGGKKWPYKDRVAPLQDLAPNKEYGTSRQMRDYYGIGEGAGWSTEMGQQPRQGTWPTGSDPVNDPYGWKNWWY